MHRALASFPDDVLAFVCKATRDQEPTTIPCSSPPSKSRCRNAERLRLYYETPADFAGDRPRRQCGRTSRSAWRTSPASGAPVAVVADVEWIKHTMMLFGFLKPAAMKARPTTRRGGAAQPRSSAEDSRKRPPNRPPPPDRPCPRSHACRSVTHSRARHARACHALAPPGAATRFDLAGAHRAAERERVVEEVACPHPPLIIWSIAAVCAASSDSGGSSLLSPRRWRRRARRALLRRRQARRRAAYRPPHGLRLHRRRRRRR